MLFLRVVALLWVCGLEVLLGNVHRKGHGGVRCRDAVHDGGQGAHAPLVRRVGSAQKICKRHTSLKRTAGVCLAWVREARAHPRCCSSACTGRGCCSTLGCCSTCCLSWARWMTTPVTMAMRTQALLSFIHSYDTAHPTRSQTAHTVGPFKNHTCALSPSRDPPTPSLMSILNAYSMDAYWDSKRRVFALCWL